MESVETVVIRVLSHMTGRVPVMSDEFVRQFDFDSLDAISLAMDLEEIFSITLDEGKFCDLSLRYTVGRLVADITLQLADMNR